jgi:hypothetical protein
MKITWRVYQLQLDFRESKGFLRGPKTLMAMKEQPQKFIVN